MTHLFALIQIPLALALVWRCAQVRKLTSPSFVRFTLLLAGGCGGGIAAWSMATLLIIHDPGQRYDGGIIGFTAAIVVVFTLVNAIGQLAKK